MSCSIPTSDWPDAAGSERTAEFRETVSLAVPGAVGDPSLVISIVIPARSRRQDQIRAIFGSVWGANFPWLLDDCVSPVWIKAAFLKSPARFFPFVFIEQ